MYWYVSTEPRSSSCGATRSGELTRFRLLLAQCGGLGKYWCGRCDLGPLLGPGDHRGQNQKDGLNSATLCLQSSSQVCGGPVGLCRFGSSVGLGWDLLAKSAETQQVNDGIRFEG